MYEHWSDGISVGFDFIVGPISSIILAITISDCCSFCGTMMSSARLLPRGSQLFFVFRGLCKYCFQDDLEFRSKFCLICKEK
ncbi:unnamed protein product [Caenorhabditis nigoni]